MNIEASQNLASTRLSAGLVPRLAAALAIGALFLGALALWFGYGPAVALEFGSIFCL